MKILAGLAHGRRDRALALHHLQRVDMAVGPCRAPRLVGDRLRQRFDIALAPALRRGRDASPARGLGGFPRASRRVPGREGDERVIGLLRLHRLGIGQGRAVGETSPGGVARSAARANSATMVSAAALFGATWQSARWRAQ